MFSGLVVCARLCEQKTSGAGGLFALSLCWSGFGDMFKLFGLSVNAKVAVVYRLQPLRSFASSGLHALGHW